MLRFPIWMLHPIDPAFAREAGNAKGYRYAFTSSERAAEFLLSMKDAAHFSIRLVSRTDAPRVAAEIRDANLRGVCLNALTTGEMGWNIDTDVFALAIPTKSPASGASVSHS